MEPRMEELMSPERRRRRCLRFRQRQYTYNDIANRTVFGDVHQHIYRLGVKEAEEILKHARKKKNRIV